MTEFQPDFRFEYVRGCIAVPAESSTFGITAILPRVFNRGRYEGAVRAFGYRQSSPTPELAFDVEGPVAPGDLWVVSYEPVEGVQPGVYWLRIWTTSANLVPSVIFEEGGTAATSGRYSTYAHVEPGDFAVFTLPHRPFPPVPPIGPTENA